MINHVSIGVRNIAEAKRFCWNCGKPVGRAWPFWINAADHPVTPDDKSGLHFCVTAPTRQSVNAFHAAALQSGGRDNGQPGLRPDYGPEYYAAFVIDPEGYRIEAYCGSA